MGPAAVARNRTALRNIVPASLTTSSALPNASVLNAATLSSKTQACKRTSKIKLGIAGPMKTMTKNKTSINILRMRTTRVK